MLTIVSYNSTSTNGKVFGMTDKGGPKVDLKVQDRHDVDVVNVVAISWTSRRTVLERLQHPESGRPVGRCDSRAGFRSCLNQVSGCPHTAATAE
jgi:hypothetical protein